MTVLSVAGCIATIWFSLSFWPLILGFALLLMGFLIASAFIIRSGVYVKTINCGNADKNQIAITFDDGPCEQTLEILKLLERFNAKASFFLIGKKAESSDTIVRAINEQKHTIGNHSYLHQYLFPLMWPTQIIKEITTTQQIIESITGTNPGYFRPPFGITNPLLSKALKGSSLKIIGWSVRSLDTVTENPKKIIERVKKRIKPGCIILLHDTSKNVIPVLEELLVYCAKLELKPVDLDEFLLSAS
jgi:peptidoglycan-N-acetylglucosamine deacetylase